MNNSNKNNEVCLEDLCGRHILTGVDRLVKVEGGRVRGIEKDVLNFTLDGITYSAVEDPDDGWRSMMESLIVSNAELINTFPECEVVGNMNDDVLELRDVKTKKIVISVGTDNLEDWYPCFVANFNPENMSINQDNQQI